MKAGHGKFIINLRIPRCLMLRAFRDAGFERQIRNYLYMHIFLDQF